MKDILFLDDDPNRCEKARGIYLGCSIVNTAADAIRLLREKPWHLACLDHDLSGEVYVDSSRPDCGMEVVRWIVANMPPVQKIIVHSHNSTAAQVMVKALKEAGYLCGWIPFGMKREFI